MVQQVPVHNPRACSFFNLIRNATSEVTEFVVPTAKKCHAPPGQERTIKVISKTMDRENVVESVSPAGRFLGNPQYLVLAAVIFLVGVTPFGNESTDGWAIFLHRSLLCGIIALCVASLGRRATSDLEIKAYLLIGGSLLVMLFAIWASSRATR